MKNKIGYALSAFEAQWIRDNFGCIAIMETGRNHETLKSLSISLQSGDILFADTNNPIIQAHLALFQSSGVVVRPSAETQTQIKNEKPANAPHVGRPRSEHINDAEVVELRDKQALTFRQIADHLSEEHGVKIHVSQVHTAYSRGLRALGRNPR